jgi:hypothetical protein
VGIKVPFARNVRPVNKQKVEINNLKMKELLQTELKFNSDSSADIQQVSPTCTKPIVVRSASTKALSIVGSSRDNGEREADDFYPTPPYAVERLLEREVFSGNIWECACGEGDISEVFKNKGFEVISTDLINRGYGEQIDFLKSELVADNIVTNPPYKLALDFVLKAKKQGRKKIAMFLKTVWLESETRFDMFQDKDFPLKTVYQFSKRVSLYKGGVKMKNSGMIAYAWYVWDKEYVGKPTIEWIR